MKARGGQVALYLVLVLVAITVLVLMNVNFFLAVRSKNHATAAGDAAALAAAGVEAELLREIGDINLERLKAAVRNEYPDYDCDLDAEVRKNGCDDPLRRLCFLGPLRALGASQNAARAAVTTTGGSLDFDGQSMREVLEKHVNEDIIGAYALDDQGLYPDPWEGAWEEYAQALRLELGSELIVGPDNCEFANAYEQYPLLSQGFYRAIEGKQWCWFHFNGEWIFSRDHSNMPQPVRARSNPIFNSEVYSLHLDIEALPEVLDPTWTNIIVKLTGCSEAEVASSWMLTNGLHKFAFYDHRWDAWSDYSGIRFNPQNFPIMGPVRPQYDTLGCAVICRVRLQVADLLEPSEDAWNYSWTAAAKPFGTTENLDGSEDVVTCLRRFVTPVAWQVHLVPVDSVGGRRLHTADAEWMTHVRDHVFAYLENGPDIHSACWYCQQLAAWEQPDFREAGQRYLQENGDQCVPTAGGEHAGGTQHAH